MADKVGIFNKALAHVGSSRITSESDRNNRAQVCNDMYDFALRSTLEAREWTFSNKRVKLSADSQITPPFGYNYAFYLPVDCMQVREVRNGMNYDIGWEVEGEILYATVPVADVRYTKYVEQISNFSASFIEALAYKLAADICVPLTQNIGLSTILSDRFDSLIMTAGALDGLQASRERLRSDRLINARNGYGSADIFHYQHGTGEISGDTSAVPEVPMPPVVTISGPTSVSIGDELEYVATIVSGSTPLTYQWRRDDNNIVGANQSSYVVESASEQDSGKYSCIVTNAVGFTQSNEIFVFIGCVVPAGSISGPEEVGQGRAATFTSFISEGNQPISYQWRKNGADLPGATSDTFTIPSSSVTDDGNYDCIFTNECGSFTSNVITMAVVPITAPVINIVPASVSPTEPDAADFSVDLVSTGGDPNISYQWYVDDVPVGSNSRFFTTDPTTAGDDFVVSVDATNSAGTSAKKSATVTPLANLISQTVFSASNLNFALDVGCTWLEVQGCGGGAGGGSGFITGGSDSVTGGAGGGGASAMETRTSVAIGGNVVAIEVGTGGAAGALSSDGADGTQSSITGAGIVTDAVWSGADGGQGITAAGNGGRGGTSYNGSLGGAGGTSSSPNGKNGVSGSGGGGGYGRFGGPFGLIGGNGGGTSIGAGGVAGVTNAASGGGGGGYSNPWWDGANTGKGGDGGQLGTPSRRGQDATGRGNGGGGGYGSNLQSQDYHLGGKGSNGCVIVRQYRKSPN